MSVTTLRGSVVWGALVALLLFGGARADESVWLSRQAGSTTILFTDVDSHVAGRVHEIILDEQPRVQGEMRLARLGELRVAVAPTDRVFADLTRGGAPDWGVACAISAEGLMVLKSPRLVDYPMDMERVIAHELTHIATRRVLRDVAVPRWFDEGVAMTVAGEWRLSQSSAMATAVLFNRLIPLAELEARFPENAQLARLAYAESFRAVEFLTTVAESEDCGELVGAVSAAGEFDVALTDLAGATRPQFYEAAEAFFKQRFGAGLLLSGWNPVILCACLLAVAAVVVRVVRRRRQLRDWEQEEQVARERFASRSRGSWQ